MTRLKRLTRWSRSVGVGKRTRFYWLLHQCGPAIRARCGCPAVRGSNTARALSSRIRRPRRG